MPCPYTVLGGDPQVRGIVAGQSIIIEGPLVFATTVV